MATNQGNIIASLQSALGAGYESYTYEGLWHAYWDDQGTAGVYYNERMLNWINDRLGSSYVDLPGAMQAYAESLGYYNWDSIDTFELGEEVITGPGAAQGSPLGLLLVLTEATA